MVLVVTHKQDYTADYVINKLNDKQLLYYRFNTEDILAENIAITCNEERARQLFGQCGFRAVWYRRTKMPELTGVNGAEHAYLLGEIDSYLENILAVVPTGRWLSLPGAVQRAENKCLQLREAAALGWKIPRTLITCDASQIVEFYKSNRQTIIKPLASGRVPDSDGNAKIIFSNLLRPEHMENISSFQLTPAIYQEYIEKEYELRVTVVDKQAFAAVVDSQRDRHTKVDWRRKRIPFESYALPETEARRCIELTKRLNLSFGAIDLVKDKNGDYCFLEINPNGQWVWIETDTGLPISEAIINYLYAE
jgi:hypothetical protein